MASEKRPRARELGIEIGSLQTGLWNAITDVPGVRVGHVTLVEGTGRLEPGKGPIRTGVTAIVPHSGNLFRERVTATAHIINGYGKSLGFPQLLELGELESPILLTNTLNVWSVADAVVDHIVKQNPGVMSVNPVVGECNDSYLNDILGRHVKATHVLEAIENADSGAMAQGNVGAGTGMSGFGWKGGVGTASRIVSVLDRDCAVGTLVITNTGSPADLRVDGVPVGRWLQPSSEQQSPAGSIMIVIATDAAFDVRQLGRLARRASFGLARMGAIASHGSGDFVIAFSTASLQELPHWQQHFRESDITLFFRAAVEAVEEAILDSLLCAETMEGRDGHVRYAIPTGEMAELDGRGAGRQGG